MKFRPFVTLSVLFAMLSPLSKAEPVKAGDPAPVATGTTESGEKLNLAEVYQKNPYTLVYFYPKADTSGCTAQGCSLRDAYAELTKKGVVVIGVSTDDVEAQKAFKQKHRLPFTLIADTDQAVIKAFGVPTRARGELQFASRQAFLIKDGKVIWADHTASTAEQAQDVLKVLAEQG